MTPLSQTFASVSTTYDAPTQQPVATQKYRAIGAKTHERQRPACCGWTGKATAAAAALARSRSPYATHVACTSSSAASHCLGSCASAPRSPGAGGATGASAACVCAARLRASSLAWHLQAAALLRPPCGQAQTASSVMTRPGRHGLLRSASAHRLHSGTSTAVLPRSTVPAVQQLQLLQPTTLSVRSSLPARSTAPCRALACTPGTSRPEDSASHRCTGTGSAGRRRARCGTLIGTRR